jgi:hypothetical protein
LREEHKAEVYENKVFRIKCEPKDKVGNLGYYEYIMRNLMLYEYMGHMM